MPVNQRDSDFFRPLWRRIAVTVFVAGWVAWEFFYTHDQTWIFIALGMLAYAVWTFFIAYKPKGPNNDAKP